MFTLPVRPAPSVWPWFCTEHGLWHLTFKLIQKLISRGAHPWMVGHLITSESLNLGRSNGNLRLTWNQSWNLSENWSRLSAILRPCLLATESREALARLQGNHHSYDDPSHYSGMVGNKVEEVAAAWCTDSATAARPYTQIAVNKAARSKVSTWWVRLVVAKWNFYKTWKVRVKA